MKRHLPRILPIAITLLVAIFAHPASVRADACDRLIQSGGNTGNFAIVQNAGVVQPIGKPGNIAAVSMSFDMQYAGGRLDLVQWDPLALAPDPTTVALRSRSFTASDILYGQTRADFSPPLVTRSVPGVADGRRAATAMDFRPSYVSTTSGLVTDYETDGAADVPIAYQYPAGGGSLTPLPGAHPVLTHRVCAGGPDLQELQVIQSVMTTNQLSDLTTSEIVQKFR